MMYIKPYKYLARSSYLTTDYIFYLTTGHMHLRDYTKCIPKLTIPFINYIGQIAYSPP